MVRYYSGNVTLRNGRASFVIPFALSDAKGEWRVRARDVVSGLTAETVITPGAAENANQRKQVNF
jgi:hypothetical protein